MWRLLVLTFAVVHADLLTEDSDHNIHVFQKHSRPTSLRSNMLGNALTKTLHVHGNLDVEGKLVHGDTTLNLTNLAIKTEIPDITNLVNKTYVDEKIAAISTDGDTIPDISGTGEYSFAMGHLTFARGDYSFAMGFFTFADGDYSFAMGSSAMASGAYSFAMGDGADATGAYSTALGYDTSASSDYSTAMGRWTTASGEYSFAMGFNTGASGAYSTAMGYDTRASGAYSFAMGRSTMASGDYSTAMGHGTIASGNYSLAMGFNTGASGDYSTAMGAYNTIDADALLSVGNGVAANNRSTAFTVYADSIKIGSTVLTEQNVKDLLALNLTKLAALLNTTDIIEN